MSKINIQPLADRVLIEPAAADSISAIFLRFSRHNSRVRRITGFE